MFFNKITPLIFKASQLLTKRINIINPQNQIRYLRISQVIRQVCDGDSKKSKKNKLTPLSDEAYAKMKKNQKYFQEQLKKGIPTYLQGPKDKLFFNITIVLCLIGIINILRTIISLMFFRSN